MRQDSLDYLVKFVSKQKVNMGVVSMAEYLPPGKKGEGVLCVLVTKISEMENGFPRKATGSAPVLWSPGPAGEA